MRISRTTLTIGAVLAIAACSDPSQPVSPLLNPSLALNRGDDGPASFEWFAPLAASTVCTVAGGDAVNPLSLPSGFRQKIIASEPDYITNGDMQAFNETGPQRGRFLYRAHETGPNTGISVTDLKTGTTQMLIRRQDWVGLDGITWTPWGTLLFAEELGSSAGNVDPDFPLATAGLVYELNPRTLAVKARPALGARSHEGQVIDAQGNYYGISERSGGAIFKFVPDKQGDYSAGQLYALKLTTDLGDRTGPGTWVALDRNAVQVNSDVEAAAKAATGYGRPEDLEILRKGNRQYLYAALTSEHRIIAIDISSAWGPIVSTVVKAGVNVGTEFSSPDNLAFDDDNHLFVSEDPGGNFPGKTNGDDIWTVRLGSPTGLATSVSRFASLTDCDAEPTGILFDREGGRLYVNVQHRGGDGLDKTLEIRRRGGRDDGHGHDDDRDWR